MEIRLSITVILLVPYLVACSGPPMSYTRVNHSPKPYLAELGLLNKTIVYRSRPLSIAAIHHVALALLEPRETIDPSPLIPPLALRDASDQLEPEREATVDILDVDEASDITVVKKRLVKPERPKRLVTTDMTRVLERYFAQVSTLPVPTIDNSLALQESRKLGAEFLLIIQPLSESNRHASHRSNSYLSQLNPFTLLKNSYLQMRVTVFDVTTGNIIDTATIAARTGRLNNRQAYGLFGEQALTAYVCLLYTSPSPRDRG